MTWTNVDLGEIIVIKKGKSITKNSSKVGPYPVILGGREPAYFIDQYNHTGKAIVVSRSGASAGYVSFWNEPIFVTDGFLIEPKGDVNIDFLYYLMKAHEEHFIGLQGGSAIPHVTPRTIGAVSVLVPPIGVQGHIANVLSTYDDLIENNKEQIALLEEAAQRLYKEWFVDLRFPGHENTRIVDGVPDGWELSTFSQKVDVMSGGTPKTSNQEYYRGTIPFYSPKDSDGAFFAFDTQTHISQSGLDNCNSKLYPEGTIIITARGTVGKSTILARPMAMNQSCYALKSEKISSCYYLFFALQHEIAALKTMANGGVFDTIIVSTFDRINILDPGHEVVGLFDDAVSPIMSSIKTKTESIMLLIEARDRLLPKLMSGEIEL